MRNARTGTGRHEGTKGLHASDLPKLAHEEPRDVPTLALTSAVQAVGESHHSESFAMLCGSRTPEGHFRECVAELVPEPENPYDKHAVGVWIDGFQIGYLSREDAQRLGQQVLDAIASHGSATCHAVIRGGWDRGSGDAGDFGVRLLPSDERARERWSARMRTDPVFRRRKLAHWQWQIEDAKRRGWPAPLHAVGGIEFYRKLHEQWHELRSLEDPTGHAVEFAELERDTAEYIAAYASRQAEIESQQQPVIAEQLARVARATAPASPDLGRVDGRHFTEFVEDVKGLMRAHRDDEAEALLLRLVEATEEESRGTGIGVAPWYYERLAVLYARQKEYLREIAVLERYSQQPHAPGVGPRRLLDRLERARSRVT